jgi:hypothetical protein
MADRTDTYYAADGAAIGYGAQILMGEGDASPETFEAIYGVRSIAMGQTEVADTDRTHLRSLNAHKEHVPGMLDTSALSFTGVYKHDEDSLSTAGGGTGPFASGGLPTLVQARGIHNFIVRLPLGSPEPEVEIRGYLTGFSINEVNTEGLIEYTCGIMPTEAMTLP